MHIRTSINNGRFSVCMEHDIHAEKFKLNNVFILIKEESLIQVRNIKKDTPSTITVNLHLILLLQMPDEY